MMNYENNENEQTSYDRVRIGSKRLGSYTLAIALIPYFNFFGFPLKHIGLMVLSYTFLALQILLIIRFIKFNHSIKNNIKRELFDDLFLVIGCLASVILSFLFVNHEYSGEQLVKINHQNFIFWIVDFVIMVVGSFVLACKSKRIR